MNSLPTLSAIRPSRRLRIWCSSASLLLAANGAVAHAQSSAGVSASGESPARVSRAALARSSIFGALSGSVLAMGFYFMSEKGERSNGCQPLNCALPFLATSGAIAGLFIGRELDAQHRAFAPRVGQSISFGFTEAITLASPLYLDVRDSLIAVASDSGAQLLSAANAPRALRRRATGLNATRMVAILPSRSALIVGTGTALWETDLVTGPASRLVDGAVDGLAVSGDAVMSASGRRLRWRGGSGTALKTDSLELAQRVSSIAYDSIGHTWLVATDSSIVQVTESGGRLTANARVLPTPTAARSIAISREWVAAALGDAGVIAWPRSSFAGDGGIVAAVRLANEPRFAYDLAFLNGQLFVAGGVDGLFQLSLSPVPRVVGSSRQMQFATTVRAGNGVLWVGDRNRRSVIRVVP